MNVKNRKLAGTPCCHPIHPICCIVPPHILVEIGQKGNPEQRFWATQTLIKSERIRGQREVLGALPVTNQPGLKRRTIYTANNTSDLPGILVRGEGDPASSNDKAVNEAYDGSGAVYDFFHDVYNRNSLDDEGMRLDSTVHFNVDYDNAFWNGSQMAYGDGDGEIFERFTKSIDIIGHELTHGVIENSSGLLYKNQPGALNESFADIFGSLVKQRVLNQTVDQADWLIGKQLLKPGVNGEGIRSLKAPGTAYDDPLLGKDPQPAHMRDLNTDLSDNGGVHINSGIPNRAFYLAAMGIGGYAWGKAGKIWYTTLNQFLRPQSGFEEAANTTIIVARQLFGYNSLEQKAVRNAWKTVGVI